MVKVVLEYMYQCRSMAYRHFSQEKTDKGKQQLQVVHNCKSQVHKSSSNHSEACACPKNAASIFAKMSSLPSLRRHNPKGGLTWSKMVMICVKYSYSTKLASSLTERGLSLS